MDWRGLFSITGQAWFNWAPTRRWRRASSMHMRLSQAHGSTSWLLSLFLYLLATLIIDLVRARFPVATPSLVLGRFACIAVYRLSRHLSGRVSTASVCLQWWIVWYLWRWMQFYMWRGRRVFSHEDVHWQWRELECVVILRWSNPICRCPVVYPVRSGTVQTIRLFGSRGTSINHFHATHFILHINILCR